MNTITDYDRIKLQFEEESITLPVNVIEKFQVQKVETFIEKKYNPEKEYEVYLVINRILAEEIWGKEGLQDYNSLAHCIEENSIYEITIYKNEQKEIYSPVWSYTQWINEYQKIGITKNKIMIHIKEV